MFSSALDLNQKIALRESNFFGGVGKVKLNQIIIPRRSFHSSGVRRPESRSAYEAAKTPCGLCESLSIRVVTKRRYIAANRSIRTAIVSSGSDFAALVGEKSPLH